MSKSPVLLNKKRQIIDAIVPEEKKSQVPPGGVQQVIAAVNDFIHDKATGCLEIHFSHGGIAKVFANHTKTYR